MAGRLSPASRSPLSSSSIRNKYDPLYPQLRTAAKIWEENQNNPAHADRWLANFFHANRKKLGSRDRRFLAETIYSLFRHQLFLETWVRTLASPEDNALPLFAAAAEGIISPEEFTGAWGKRVESEGLTPSELYHSLRNKEFPRSLKISSEEERLSLRYSFPLWLIRRWTKTFGAVECRKLLEASNERPPLVVRVNPLKMDREKLIARFRKKGFRVLPTERSPFGIFFLERVNLFDSEEFQKGFFEIQDEGSQLVCQRMEPKPGEVIWDVCAGGGGKSLHLAALMQNKGRIIATDIRERKIEDLKKRAARAGAYNIFPAELGRIEETREIKRGIDKILVDAPCSGTGTLRRNPDAKWKLTEEKLRAYHGDQVAILEKALPHLKTGGRVYYVTCSLEPVENEEVMDEILGRHSELKKIAYPVSRDGYFRLLPHKHQTDGFFLGIAENKG